MKRNILFVVLFVLSVGLITTSCESDSNSLPEIKEVKLADDNKSVTVTFSEPVFSKNDGTGALESSDFDVKIEGVTFTHTVQHTAGSATATINIMITSIVKGSEFIEIKAVANSIFDEDGEAMEIAMSLKTSALAEAKGIIGKWQSSGANVAPLLAGYFKTDSVYAEFKDDLTYIVKEYRNGIKDTPAVLYDGTFVIEKSTVGEIWKITITQANPYAANVAGIFEIKSDGTLWYEVVQLSGTQNTAPTPEEGFGSTTSGQFGTTNIQKYLKVN